MKQRTFISDSLFKLLTLAAIVLLPFTKALTLPVGFPLKGYEIILPISFMLLFFRGKFFFSNDFKRLFTLFFIFFIIAFMSTLYAQFDIVSNLYSDYRGGRFPDGLMRSAYLLFNILSLLVAFNMARLYTRVTINAWFLGLIFTFSYHFLTFVFFLSTGDAPLLPGLERHQIGWVGSIFIPRSGTFEEGNFAGLYYLVSLALAVYSGSSLITILATCGVLLTLSTSTYLALVVFTLLYLRRGKSLSFLNFTWLAFTLLSIIAILIQVDVLSKFGEDAGSSGAVRFNEAMTGLQIFFAHPFRGVGLGGYGYYFDEHEWDSALSIFFGSDKHIANNVYIEILSEMGIFGFLIFFAAIFTWYRIIRKREQESHAFLAVAAPILIIFNAYPTFNITYLWFFIGISVGMTSIDFIQFKGKNDYLQCQKS